MDLQLLLFHFPFTRAIGKHTRNGPQVAATEFIIAVQFIIAVCSFSAATVVAVVHLQSLQ